MRKGTCTQILQILCHLLLTNMSNVFSVASVDNKSCQNLILQKIRVAFRCVLRQWEVLGRMQSCNNPLEVQEASESSLLVSLDLDLSQKQHQDTSLD